LAGERIDPAGLNLEERVVDIWRCAAVVKGGRRFSFSALAVVGNGHGVVGMGYAKAREVPQAIEKAVKDAKKNLVRVPTHGTTIPHEIRGRYGASKVVMLPALPGTGLIAGAATRAVLECLGVRDILTKSVGGSNNGKNLVKAAFNGLQQLRTREDVAALRGIEVEEDTQLKANITAMAQARRRDDFRPERSERGGGGGGGDRRRGRGRGRPDENAQSAAVAAPSPEQSASPDTVPPGEPKKE